MIIKRLVTALGACLLSIPVFAQELDTSKLILCAVRDVHECVDGAPCQEVLHEEVSAPTFLRINMKKNEVIVTNERPASKIEHKEEVEGRIVMQGIEDGFEDRPDGVGWTLSIEKATARMVISAAAAQAAIIGFGSCTEL